MRQKAIECDRRQYQMNDADWSMVRGNELLSGRSLCTTVGATVFASYQLNTPARSFFYQTMSRGSRFDILRAT